jgi:IclR family KDG regulon transcriptional repressor
MIQVIHRALNVLEHLSRAGEHPSVLSDIARATGLNAATCARILSTLMGEGYVEQEGRRKGYRLGPMAYTLTARGPYRKDLVACAEPLVRELAEATGETVIVAILQQNTRYTICRTEGNHDVQVRTDAVLRDDVYPYATGRVLLAHMKPAEVDAFVVRSGLPEPTVWPEARTKAGLLAELAKVRAMSTVVTTTKNQIAGLALPIRNDDRVVAALGLYLPASRFVGAHRESLLHSMEVTAHAISARLTEMYGATQPL